MNEIPPDISEPLDSSSETSIEVGILTGMAFSVSIHNGNSIKILNKTQIKIKYTIY